MMDDLKVIVLLVLACVLVAVGLLVIDQKYESAYCESLATTLNTNFKYSYNTGCLLEVESEKYVPKFYAMQWFTLKDSE
jgi:hypothetical protein